jgi:guanylate kinase
MPAPTSAAPKIHRRGFMVILSSPSGAGKTTLSRLLLERDDNLQMSVSVTTRKKRPNEKEGVDYYFVSKDEFLDLTQKNELLESAEVFGNFYGTPQKPVIEALESGRDVLFDIDWQGTEQVCNRQPADVVTIFILPPTMEELQSRLQKRAQDTADVVKYRMEKAAGEISHWNLYEYVIINHDLTKSLEDITAIVRAERRKRERQQGMAGFIKSLIG